MKKNQITLDDYRISLDEDINDVVLQEDEVELTSTVNSTSNNTMLGYTPQNNVELSFIFTNGVQVTLKHNKVEFFDGVESVVIPGNTFSPHEDGSFDIDGITYTLDNFGLGDGTFINTNDIKPASAEPIKEAPKVLCETLPRYYHTEIVTTPDGSFNVYIVDNEDNSIKYLVNDTFKRFCRRDDIEKYPKDLFNGDW